MAGFNLCAKRSGKTSNTEIPVISRQGKSDIHYALYQVAKDSIIQEQDFIVYFTNKLKDGQEKKA